MKIEKISTNKIKVTLTNEDMLEWELNFDNLTYNSPQVQELFWDVIRRAEYELGFFVDNAQLMVEAMPTKSEGFVMIVSKVDEQQSLAKHVKSRPKRTEIKVKRKPRSIIQPQIYEFEEFDDVVNVCCQIYDLFEGYSLMYKYNNRFYLSLLNINDMDDEKISYKLLEYGKRMPYSATIEGKLVEYGEVMIKKNAIEVINKVFR